LGVTQIPNPAYAIAIATASQVALEVVIVHHGTMPNSLNSVPISVNLYLQQPIVAITNIPPTIDAPMTHSQLLKRLKCEPK